jgi:hypothetical protein
MNQVYSLHQSHKFITANLEVMGLLGTLYYYTQLELGWELNSTFIDKLSNKLGIADIREYIGIRK